MSSLLWIDVETSALGDKAAVLQVALYPVINGEHQKPYTSYIQPHPGAQIDPGALKINKLNPKDFPSYPLPETVVKEMIDYLDKFETVFSLAAHNVAFDRSHFVRLFNRTANYGNYITRFDAVEYCTLEMAKQVFKDKKNKPKSNKLGDICKYFDIELSNAHDALSDITATVQVYEKLSAMMAKPNISFDKLTYLEKRIKYLTPRYYNRTPGGGAYLSEEALANSDITLFLLGEIHRVHVKD